MVLWEIFLDRAMASYISHSVFNSSLRSRTNILLLLYAESGAFLRDSSRVPWRCSYIFLNRHTTLSGQSRVYRVTQLRTDGVHYRESIGTGPVNLKVVSNECCLGGHHGPINMRLSFPHLLYYYWYEVVIACWKCVCVFFPFILDIKFVGRTSRGHPGERSHSIFYPPSFCGACLNFSREKDSVIPFPRRP